MENTMNTSNAHYTKSWYTEESVLLPYTPVEGRIMKFWRNDKMLWFLTYEQL